MSHFKKDKTSAEFSNPETWRGGFFELAIEVGPWSIHAFDRAIKLLWQYPKLIGCYLSNDQDPLTQELSKPVIIDDEPGPHLYGLASFPNGSQIPCGSCTVRMLDDGEDSWIDFYFPLGALGAIYDIGGYPFDSRDPTLWLREVETWLADLGLWLCPQINAKLALIGFEVSGVTNSRELAKTGVPESRRTAYLCPEEVRFQFYPSNKH